MLISDGASGFWGHAGLKQVVKTSEMIKHILVDSDVQFSVE